MRRITVTGLSLAVSVAMALAGSTAALAAPKLVLSENGIQVPAGGFALSYQLAFDGGCLQESQGQLLINAKPTDKLEFAPPIESECLESGYSQTGVLKKITLKSTGAATLSFSPKLEITEPGPCVYSFSRFTGTFPATIEVDIEGSGTGKLRHKGAASSCTSTRTVEFDAVESGITNDIFGSEVLP